MPSGYKYSVLDFGEDEGEEISPLAHPVRDFNNSKDLAFDQRPPRDLAGMGVDISADPLPKLLKTPTQPPKGDPALASDETGGMSRFRRSIDTDWSGREPRGLGNGFAADASGGLKALGEMAKGSAPPPDDGSGALRLYRMLESAKLLEAQRADRARKMENDLFAGIESGIATMQGRKADLSRYQDKDPDREARAFLQQLDLATGRRREDREERRFGLETKREERLGQAAEMDLEAKKAETVARKAEREALADPNSNMSKLIIGTANRMGAKLPPGTSGDQAMRMMPHLEKAFQIETQAESQRLQQAALADARRERSEQKELMRQDKRYFGRDWELKEGAGSPPEPVRTAFMNRQMATDVTAEKIRELKGIFDKTGGGGLLGTDATRMNQLAVDILLELKEVKNLGVLNGKDLEVLEKLSPNPAKFGDYLKNKIGAKDVGTAIAELGRLMENDMAVRAGVLGLVPKAGGTKAGSPQPYGGGAAGGASPGKTIAEERIAPDGRRLIRYTDGSREIR